MRLEQLYYFIEIAHSKSISIAAENLYITQPALSRAIKALESELSITLFHRSVEGVLLTDHGHVLYAEVHDILKKIEQLQNHAHALSNQPSQMQPCVKLNILTFSTLADTLFLSALAMLQQQHPHVMVSITNLKLNSFSEQPDWSDYDLVVLTDISDILLPMTQQTGLYREELFFESYFAVAHQRHLLSSKKFVSLQDIFAHKVIVPQNGLPTEALFQHLLANEAPVPIFMQSNNARVIMAALCQQDTVLISTNALIQQDYYKHPELCIIPIKAIKGNCFALYDPEHPYHYLLRELLTYLKSARLKGAAVPS